MANSAFSKLVDIAFEVQTLFIFQNEFDHFKLKLMTFQMPIIFFLVFKVNFK